MAISYLSEITHSDDLFDILQAKFPILEECNSPHSPINAGIAALERRASKRRGASRSRDNSPASDHSSAVPTSLPNGTQSTHATSEPVRLDNVRLIPPPLKSTKIRPRSELFLPTPSTNKRMTIFRLPESVEEEPAQGEEEELTLPPLSHSTSLQAPTIKRSFYSKIPLAEPPLSPISSALAKARFSRLDVHASIRHAISNLNVEDPIPVHLRDIASPLPRASTAPPSIQRKISSATMKSTRSLPLRLRSIGMRGGSSRVSRLRPTATWSQAFGFSGIDKDTMAEKRANAVLAKRKSGYTASSLVLSGTATPPSSADKPFMPVMPWRQRKRGETMSMLIDAGFFPVKELITPTIETAPVPGRRARKKVDLSILVKDLPPTPLSIVGTPVDFYQHVQLSPRRAVRASNRRSVASRRRLIGKIVTSTPPLSLPTSPMSLTTSPLSPFSIVASPITPEEPSEGLEVIHEDHTGAEAEEDTVVPDSMEIEPDTVPTFISEELRKSVVVKDLNFILPDLEAPSTATDIEEALEPANADETPQLASPPLPELTRVATIEEKHEPIVCTKTDDDMADEICDWWEGWGFEAVSFAHDAFFNAITATLPIIAKENDGYISDSASITDIMMAANAAIASVEGAFALKPRPLSSSSKATKVSNKSLPSAPNAANILDTEADLYRLSSNTFSIGSGSLRSASSGDVVAVKQQKKRQPPKKKTGVQRMRRFVQNVGAVV